MFRQIAFAAVCVLAHSLGLTGGAAAAMQDLGQYGAWTAGVEEGQSGLYVGVATPGDVPNTMLSVVCWPRRATLEIVLHLPYSLATATKQAMVQSRVDGRAVQEALWTRNENPAAADMLSTPDAQAATGLAVSLRGGRQLTIEVSLEVRRDRYCFSLRGFAQASEILPRTCLHPSRQSDPNVP
jgi:hypothetical protein